MCTVILLNNNKRFNNSYPLHHIFNVRFALIVNLVVYIQHSLFFKGNFGHLNKTI